MPEKSVLNAISFQSSQTLQCFCDQQAAEPVLGEGILLHAGWFVKDADNPRLPIVMVGIHAQLVSVQPQLTSTACTLCCHHVVSHH